MALIKPVEDKLVALEGRLVRIQAWAEAWPDANTVAATMTMGGTLGPAVKNHTIEPVNILVSGRLEMRWKRRESPCYTEYELDRAKRHKCKPRPFDGTLVLTYDGEEQGEEGLFGPGHVDLRTYSPRGSCCERVALDTAIKSACCEVHGYPSPSNLCQMVGEKLASLRALLAALRQIAAAFPQPDRVICNEENKSAHLFWFRAADHVVDVLLEREGGGAMVVRLQGAGQHVTRRITDTTVRTHRARGAADRGEGLSYGCVSWEPPVANPHGNAILAAIEALREGMVVPTQ